MSGGGGGRDDYSAPRSGGDDTPSGAAAGGGGGAGVDPCAIVQRAPLNSPKPAVAGTLNAGDMLKVVLNEASGRPILEVHAVGGIAGALTHNGHLRLVECIRQGHEYVAEVKGRQGGAVDLLVRPK